MKRLRRYAFSERLADVLGVSRRDVRFRVTLLVSGGIVAPGPRGPGSPPATSDYAADLLLGVMAAPQQADTVEAIRCYGALQRTVVATGDEAAAVVLDAADTQVTADEPDLLAGPPRFGDAVARLLDLARDETWRPVVARDLFGLWVARGFPVAAIQAAAWIAGRRAVMTQRFELPPGAMPPAWLDPERGGSADPGLHHTVFLPVRKLIEIGALTAPIDERTSTMLNIDSAVSNLARKIRDRTDRGRWEKFLDAARAARAAAETIDARPSRLVEVTEFGANPGNLQMFKYVPSSLPANAPLVVVLHGCTQSARSYDHGTGWSTLADRHGFAVLVPQQKRSNNPLRCFNWFRPEDNRRDTGEALSIRRMVEKMISDHGLDRGRVYVNGVSAGGAMTAAMLATYPDVFAGGAIIAGVPYGCAEGLQEAFQAIFQSQVRSADEWAGRVRHASSHHGPWPRLSVWHGDADGTVNPQNAEEIVKQWAALHHVGGAPTAEDTVEGHRRRVWHGPDGEDRIESYTISGMGHGVPIDPNGNTALGSPQPFIVDVGISSTFHIARFWGLTEGAPVQRSTATPQEEVETGGADTTGSAIAAEARPTTDDRQDDTGPGADTGRDTGSSGIDIGGILGKSFELAGLAAGAAKGRGRGPGGVDVSAILGKSFELAGMMAEGAGRTSSGDDATDEGWHGDWQHLADALETPDDGPVLFGYAASGLGGTGARTRTISRRLRLGDNATLRYVRRLELDAAVNAYTTAAFRVRVDGAIVDEASAAGMTYAETEWTERAEIDLSRYAGREVTIAFEVTANANVCQEVSARAWVGGVMIQEITVPANA